MALLIGIIVSFLGQLPVGFINLIALKISVEKNTNQALQFALGIALLEMLYLTVVLYCIHWIVDNPSFYFTVQVITVLVFLYLGIKMIAAWRKNKNNESSSKSLKYSNDFINGIFLSSINLAQIPFWIVWSTYLINMNWLTNTTNNFLLFVMGTGFGTIGGMLMYIFGGKLLLSKLKNGNKYLQLSIGIMFIVAALFQLVRMIG